MPYEADGFLDAAGEIKGAYPISANLLRRMGPAELRWVRRGAFAGFMGC